MKPILKDTIKSILVYLVLCISVFLMLKLISQYTRFDDRAGFLAFKQDYIFNPVWETAFYVHVFSAVFVLFAGFTQFSTYLQKKYKKIHRFIGKLYVINILIINFPAALVMAVYANGLLSSRIAFVILDCLWFWFTLKAFLEARKGNFNIHRNFMIRSYALSFSAITLRSWKLVLTSMFVLDPLAVYMMDAWLGFVPNLLLAEWIIRQTHKKESVLTLEGKSVNNNQESNEQDYRKTYDKRGNA